MEPTDMSARVRVWDLPTRIFHWTLVALVIIAWLTAEDEPGWFLVHSLAGYGVFALILFRLAWGVVGTRHARFGDFVFKPKSVAEYVRGVLRGEPGHWRGHNPLGGWMILLLLATLTVLVVTGLFGAEDDVAGPWAGAVSRGIAHGLAEFHEGLFGALQVLVAIHVVGVVADRWISGDNLIKAMWTGYKARREGAPGAADVPVAAARGLVVMLIAGGVVWFAVA